MPETNPDEIQPTLKGKQAYVKGEVVGDAYRTFLLSPPKFLSFLKKQFNEKEKTLDLVKLVSELPFEKDKRPQMVKDFLGLNPRFDLSLNKQTSSDFKFSDFEDESKTLRTCYVLVCADYQGLVDSDGSFYEDMP